MKLNSGSMRKEKRASAKAPDYRGKINVHGNVYSVLGWDSVNSQTKEQYIALWVESEILPHETEEPAQ